MKVRNRIILILLALLVFESTGIVIHTIKSRNTDVVEAEVEENVSIVYLGEFKLTGYCDCPICQEEWVGMTATGVAPTVNNTIAVDPDVIPLGSYVWINSVRYHAEDVGGMVNGQRIDIFCGSHEECYSEFCNGYADVYIEVPNEG